MESKYFNKVTTLGEAIEIMVKEGIKFDRCYSDVFFNGRDYITGKIRVSSGVHLYFNYGAKLNVAYYTPMMDTLCIMIPGRIDGTCESSRQYKPEVMEHLAYVKERVAREKE